MTTPRSRTAARTARRAQPRITRPELEREAPDRSPSGYLRGAAHHPGMRAAQRVVETSVEGAYRVIQEYLRWGQRSAEQFTPFESKKVHMGDHHYDDRRDPAAQWFEMWQRMYMQWMSMFMPGMWGPFMPGMRGPGSMGMHDLELELDLDAGNRKAKVSLCLDRPPWGGGKARLHSRDGDHDFTVDVSERGRVKIHIGEKPPDGEYSGKIKDHDGATCGHMKLVLSR